MNFRNFIQLSAAVVLGYLSSARLPVHLQFGFLIGSILMVTFTYLDLKVQNSKISMLFLDLSAITVFFFGVGVLQGLLMSSLFFVLMPLSRTDAPGLVRVTSPRKSLMSKIYLSISCGLLVLSYVSNSHNHNYMTFFLAWAGLSFLMAAAAYGTIDPLIFGKHLNGQMTLAYRFLLKPFRLFIQAYQKITHGGASKRSELIGSDVYVRMLPPFFVETHPSIDLCAEHHRFVYDINAYRTVPCLDLTAMSISEFNQAMLYAQELKNRYPHLPLFINCALGRGRSAATAVAWLLYSRQATTLNQAIGMVKQGRPEAVFPEEMREALRRWHESIH